MFANNRQYSILTTAVLLGVLLYSGIDAWKRKWVCDDAFISYRYASNWISGHGLVFNPEEYTEGYSNFLWTCIIALAMKLGFYPENFSMIAGIFFYILTLLTCLYYSFQLNEGKKVFLLLSSMIPIALHKYMRVYSTSGLETAFFTFLIFSGMLVFFYGNKSWSQSVGSALLCLGAMSRPEGVLFSITALGYSIILGQKHRIGFLTLIRNHLFFLIVYPAYLFWKIIYYGDILPNTYYAKAGEALWLKGFAYFKLYFQSYYIFVFLFIFIFIIHFLRGKKNLIKKEIYIILPCLLYMVHILRVGGDFMFARFFIPITPFFYILGERANSVLGIRFRILVQIVVIIGTLAYFNPYRGIDIPKIGDVTLEEEIYKLERVIKVRDAFQKHAIPFNQSGARIAFGGSQAMLVYYLNPLYALEAETGLTDRELARMKADRLGRVGHNKNADLTYLKKRNIHLHFQPGNLPGKRDYNGFYFTGFPFEMRVIQYDPKMMKKLRDEKIIESMDFDAFLVRDSLYWKHWKREDLKSRLEEYQNYSPEIIRNNEKAIDKIFKKM